MKITASLITSPTRWQRPLAIGLWLAALGLLGSAGYMLQEAATARSDIPAALRRLSVLEPQLAAAKNNQLPPAGDLAAMRQRVGALNAISGPRGATSTALLAWLEQHLPGDVALASLQYRARDGEVVLVAESAGAETLTKFLLRLETEPRFTDVMLTRQGARGQDKAGGVQFEIRLRMRS
jgi:hypothetical protein